MRNIFVSAYYVTSVTSCCGAHRTKDFRRFIPFLFMYGLVLPHSNCGISFFNHEISLFLSQFPCTYFATCYHCPPPPLPPPQIVAELSELRAVTPLHYLKLDRSEKLLFLQQIVFAIKSKCEIQNLKNSLRHALP